MPIPVPKAQPWMHVVAPVWSAPPMGEGALPHVLPETKFAQDGNVHHLPLSCSVVVWLYWGYLPCRWKCGRLNNCNLRFSLST